MRWLAVALGIALGVASQLRWGAPRGKIRTAEPAPTNATLRVAATDAVVSVTAPTNVAARVVQTNAVGAATATSAAIVATKPSRQPIRNDPKVPKARQVLLANRRIAVATGRSFPKKFCATQTPTSRGTAPYVVISELPVSREVRIQAVANGAKVVGFLPNNALLVEADAAALKNLEEDVLFAAAVEYEPTDKIQRALLDEKGDTVEANVAMLNPKDLDAVRRFIADNGGTLLRGAPTEGRSLCAEMPRTLVEKLAGMAEVKWIERHLKLKINNDIAVQPGLMNVTPAWNNYGLTGAGQIISTSDTGIDTGFLGTLHADLRNAVIGMQAVVPRKCRTLDSDGHGTHTAGSLVGDGTMSDGQIRGTAYGAKLWVWCMADRHGNLYCPETYDELFKPNDEDAHIHSASWGTAETEVCDYGGAYTTECSSLDQYVWEHADFLPVFAAGNAGERQASCAVMPFATAKNLLAVGASQSTRTGHAATIASFSSCGPCKDGRIKPDIVAPGTYIYSTRTTSSGKQKSGLDQYYTLMSGTSMSTPLTAGTAALVREWLAKCREKANPSAALVKAVLTGGATDLFYESGNNVLSSVPDTRQGWGRVNLGESIFPTNGLAVFLADRLPFAAGSNFTFRVTTTNAAPLNVQLVWVDHSAEAEAEKTLVNDLDLRVTAAGQTWLGNGGTEPDDVNNAESVRIRSAAARKYVVTVSCPTIPYDHTEGGAAAIYIRGAFDPQAVKCGVEIGTIWMVQ